MGFWNRENREGRPDREVLQEWSEAKLITRDQADHNDQLSIGWYLYKTGFRWNTLKPNETKNGFVREYDFHTAREAQDWLGIPIPSELIQEEEGKLSLQEQLAQVMPEKYQAEEKPQIKVEYCIPVKTKRKCQRKRSIGVYCQMTNEEYVKLKKLTEESGMSQSEFIRKKIFTDVPGWNQMNSELKGKFRELNENLQSIRCEMGKMGGMLKMTIRPNEEQKALNPQDWKFFITLLHDIEYMKKRISKTLETINGYLKA